MAQITTNQRSYSNALSLLNVAATATRTAASTVSITANWRIYTDESYHTGSGGTRYLVLFIGSESGTKYYSAAIGSSWEKHTDYNGSYTFTGIPLAAEATEITIGFGVSNSSNSLSASGTLIWNGNSISHNSTYSPDIQFNKITGIAKGYTACTAPTSFTASPAVFEDTVTLTWSGAKGGTNNTITGYETQFAESEDGVSWGGWANRGTDITSPAYSTPELVRGHYIKYRIRTLGSAGSAYYSEWKESNAVQKDNEPYVYIGNDAGDSERHLSHIYDENIDTEDPFGKYMPYVFDGTTWQRYS